MVAFLEKTRTKQPDLMGEIAILLEVLNTGHQI